MSAHVHRRTVISSHYKDSLSARQEPVQALNQQQASVSPVGVVPVSTVKSQRLNSHRAVFSYSIKSKKQEGNETISRRKSLLVKS